MALRDATRRSHAKDARFVTTFHEAVHAHRPDNAPYRTPRRPARSAAIAPTASTGASTAPAPPRAIARGGYVTQRVFFADEATAVAAGYRPCATCLPEAYTTWKERRAMPLDHTTVVHPDRRRRSCSATATALCRDPLRRRRRSRPDRAASTTAVLGEAARQLQEYAARRARDASTSRCARASAAPSSAASGPTSRSIPYGTTTTYGEIAHALDAPGSARAVGAANGRNPIPIVVPCHRVIGASGALTGYAGGLDSKRRLLEHEGALLAV